MYHLRTLSITAVTCALLLGTATTARASAADDKRAEAARIAAKREQLVQKAERLNEESKAAEDKLATLSVDISAAGVALNQQTTNLGDMQRSLADVALRTYLFGQAPQAIDILADPGGLNEYTVREGYAGTFIGAGNDAIDTVRATQQDIERATKALDVKNKTQADLVSSLNLSRANVTKTQAELATLATKVDGELTVLVEEEARRQAQQLLERERAAVAKEAARLQAAADAESKKKAASALALRSSEAIAARVKTPVPGAAPTTAKPAAPVKPSKTWRRGPFDSDAQT